LLPTELELILSQLELPIDKTAAFDAQLQDVQ
jgi:hypothetical protein